MRYAFRDPRDVGIERESKHSANVWRRMREILREWEDLFLEKVHRGAAFSEDSWLVMVWVGKRPSRRFLTLLRQFILLTNQGSLSTVSLLLKDVLLHRCLHHSPPSRPQSKDSIRISRTIGRWRFCDQARQYSTLIRSFTASQPLSSPIRRWFQRYRSRQRECVYPSRATSSSDTYWWYSTHGQPSSRQAY